MWMWFIQWAFFPTNHTHYSDISTTRKLKRDGVHLICNCLVFNVGMQFIKWDFFNHNQYQQLENLKRGFEWKAFNCNCWNSTNLIFFQLQLLKENFQSRGVSLICNCPMLECEEHQYFPSSTLLMRLKIQYCTHGTHVYTVQVHTQMHNS